jgi:hypothetical protein
MIDERMALIMLNGNVSNTKTETRHTEEFYQSVQQLATASLLQCERNNMQKLDEYLAVAVKLYLQGNETVRNGIVNIYLYTLAHAMGVSEELTKRLNKILPAELLMENNRQHYCSGI